MHLSIVAPETARASLVFDLIGDLDATLAVFAGEALASHDAGPGGHVDVTLDLSHVARFEPDGVRDLGRLVAERRLAGSPTSVVAPSSRLRSKLKAAGIGCEMIASRETFPQRHVMIARHSTR